MSPSYTSVLVVDNGASTIKAGIAGDHKDPLFVPNSVARSKQERRTFIGDEILEAKDFSAITYRVSFDRGYLVGWDAEKPVWDRLFLSEKGLNVDPATTSLLITEPYNNLPSLQSSYDQMVFEEYEFESYHRCTPASLVPYQPSLLFPPLASSSRHQPPIYPECYILVDAGHSYTHVIPIMEGKVVHSAIKRIDVGGKLLTNHLKTLISFRHWNMMDQTHVVNEAKEKCCFVSDDFARDLDICRSNPRSNSIVQEYALPDFTSTFKTGYIKRGPNAEISPRAIAAAAALGAKNKSSTSTPASPPPTDTPVAMVVEEDDDQILPLGNERFSVPEVLFSPTDIGLPQAGIPETIAQSIALLPEDLQGMFWSSIGIFGGSTLFPGFKERLQSSLQPLSPYNVSPRVFTADQPLLTPYLAAQSLACDPHLYNPLLTTRSDYLESGTEALARRRRAASPKEGWSRKRGARRPSHSSMDDDEEMVLVRPRGAPKPVAPAPVPAPAPAVGAAAAAVVGGVKQEGEGAVLPKKKRKPRTSTPREEGALPKKKPAPGAGPGRGWRKGLGKNGLGKDAVAAAGAGGEGMSGVVGGEGGAS